MTNKIDFQSIAETHERPFLIIDDSRRIVAANSAFLAAYGTSLSQVLGRTCHDVTHGQERPCFELGEECPQQRIQETRKAHACLHVHTHYDAGRHTHQVRVKGFPLFLEDGRLYYGELFEELAVGRDEALGPQYMVGGSNAFMAALEDMKRAARSDAPLLIQGETGTGKELVAAFVHANSARSSGPFLILDCTVLTESLAESELFGHERGAFTGSVGDRQGLFKLADGGTLFLDEIGELSRSLQTKLLRVLESGEFRRLGGHRAIRTDVRIVCATNRQLAEEVHSGAFREDLYYRLACLNVSLPPLRERRDDIAPLATLLLERSCESGQRRLHLTDGAVTRLQAHDFPGNVRELRNILQAAATRATGSVIDQAMIEQTLSSRLPVVGGRVPGSEHPTNRVEVRLSTPESTTRADLLADVERKQLAGLLDRHDGDRAAIAASLGVSVRTVYRKLKRFGLR